MEVYRQPSRLSRIRHAEIPSDALTLIKIASGESKALEEEARELGVEEASLHEASLIYLRTVISSAGKNHARALALPRNATLADVKSHKRWLLKWLHPDTNHSAWESQLFYCVSAAAKHFETNPHFLAIEGNTSVTHENRRGEIHGRRSALRRRQNAHVSATSDPASGQASRLPVRQRGKGGAWHRFRHLLLNRLVWLAFSVLTVAAAIIFSLALGA
jgi:hypothetical protein